MTENKMKDLITCCLKIPIVLSSLLEKVTIKKGERLIWKCQILSHDWGLYIKKSSKSKDSEVSLGVQ